MTAFQEQIEAYCVAVKDPNSTPETRADALLALQSTINRMHAQRLTLKIRYTTPEEALDPVLQEAIDTTTALRTLFETIGNYEAAQEDPAATLDAYKNEKIAHQQLKTQADEMACAYGMLCPSQAVTEFARDFLEESLTTHAEMAESADQKEAENKRAAIIEKMEKGRNYHQRYIQQQSHKSGSGYSLEDSAAHVATEVALSFPFMSACTQVAAEYSTETLNAPAFEAEVAQIEDLYIISARMQKTETQKSVYEQLRAKALLKTVVQEACYAAVADSFVALVQANVKLKAAISERIKLEKGPVSQDPTLARMQEAAARAHHTRAANLHRQNTRVLIDAAILAIEAPVKKAFPEEQDAAQRQHPWNAEIAQLKQVKLLLTQGSLAQNDQKTLRQIIVTLRDQQARMSQHSAEKVTDPGVIEILRLVGQHLKPLSDYNGSAEQKARRIHRFQRDNRAIYQSKWLARPKLLGISAIMMGVVLAGILLLAAAPIAALATGLSLLAVGLVAFGVRAFVLHRAETLHANRASKQLTTLDAPARTKHNQAHMHRVDRLFFGDTVGALLEQTHNEKHRNTLTLVQGSAPRAT